MFKTIMKETIVITIYNTKYIKVATIPFIVPVATPIKMKPV